MTEENEGRAAFARRLENDDYDIFENATLVRGNETRPVAFRASEPLVDALDSLAAKGRKSRASLIQEILWEHVRNALSIRDLIRRFPLGSLEFHVLDALISLGGSATAVEVRRWLRERMNDRSRLPGILVVLAQLLERGFVTGTESGEADVLYEITASGRDAYEKTRRTAHTAPSRKPKHA
jgi:DNA-binding PadR family transcriptional regulator